MALRRQREVERGFIPAVLCRSALLLLITVVPALAADPDEFPGLQVQLAFFTSKVDDQTNYVEPGMVSGIRLPRGPIFLWTKITGTEETLVALQSKKAFPIWHEWTYTGAYGEAPDAPESAEHIYIGKIAGVAALTSEVASSPQGIFDWRTWSGKQFLQYGRYRVVIMCGSGSKRKILQCQGKDCIYYFDYLP